MLKLSILWTTGVCLSSLFQEFIYRCSMLWATLYFVWVAVYSDYIWELHLYAIYRPGSVSVSSAFFDDLSDTLHCVIGRSEPIFIVGDHNVRLDRLDDRDSQKLTLIGLGLYDNTGITKCDGRSRVRVYIYIYIYRRVSRIYIKSHSLTFILLRSLAKA